MLFYSGRLNNVGWDKEHAKQAKHQRKDDFIKMKNVSTFISLTFSWQPRSQVEYQYEVGHRSFVGCGIQWSIEFQSVGIFGSRSSRFKKTWRTKCWNVFRLSLWRVYKHDGGSGVKYSMLGSKQGEPESNCV